MEAGELFTLPEGAWYAEYFDLAAQPWAWLPQIKRALAAFDFGGGGPRAQLPPQAIVKGDVYLHPTVKIYGPCYLEGPAWIGPDVEIRPNAFVRGNVIVERGSVLGNACEYKNALLLEAVETAHYNYVGDSILGRKAHLGAGVICANLKLARDEVRVTANGQRHWSGLRKLGALVGDEAEVGCNSVLQPGTILGRRSAVISMVFHGELPAERMAMPGRVVRRVGLGGA